MNNQSRKFLKPLFPVLLLTAALSACTLLPTSVEGNSDKNSALFPKIQWGERTFTHNYIAEGSISGFRPDSNADTSGDSGSPPGTDTVRVDDNFSDDLVVSLSFSMPEIKNAKGNPAWEYLNSLFAEQADQWIDKGSEYLYTPGLESRNSYSVKVTHSIQRCDKLLSIRYQRIERLKGRPAVTYSGAVYNMSKGEQISMEQLFSVPPEEYRSQLLDEVEMLDPDTYSRADYEGYFDENHFYLTDNALVLLFPIYSKGCSSPLSTLELAVPLAHLEEISSDLLTAK